MDPSQPLPATESPRGDRCCTPLPPPRVRTASGCRPSGSRTPGATWSGPSVPTTGAWAPSPPSGHSHGSPRRSREAEPVTVLVSAAQYVNARERLPLHVRVVEMSNNDSWVRDTGPSFVVNDSGQLRAVSWRFNAWGGLRGGLYFPWDADDMVGPKVCDLERVQRYLPGPHPRGRLDRRGRPGHRPDHRGVPAQPQPEPGPEPRGDRGGAPHAPRRVAHHLAAARGAPRRDRRPHRQLRALRRAGGGDADVDRRLGRPAVGDLERGAVDPRGHGRRPGPPPARS